MSTIKPDPLFIESLCDVPWYTADTSRPYLVKAAANPKTGYTMLITDLEFTYFCAADPNTILSEKKVKILLVLLFRNSIQL